MATKLTTAQVRGYLDRAIASFPHKECETCECFLGYLAQLEMDSVDTSRVLIEGYQPSRHEIHSCLGCDPCPPGDHYAEYLQEYRRKAQT